jgi:D-glycero-alpha-D-manno-heptose-7-phosphate kinase
VIFRAKVPLRVSFAGGGTDVPPYPQQRGGVVLATTIDKYAYASLAPREDGEITVHSLDYDIVAKFDADDALLFDGEFDAVKATLRRLGEPRGLDLFLRSDAPPGSGLGSSSAMIVALIGVLARWGRQPMTSSAVADCAVAIERGDLGIKGGLQDQYATAFGGFNLIEFHPTMTVVNPLRVDRDYANELEYRLLLCYTGRTRLSGNILARQIDNYAAEKPDVMAALNQLKQITLDMKNALLQGRLDDFGALMHTTWENKKRLEPTITDAAIDEMYAEARRAGALGGKILGAGGGGFFLFFCPFERRHIIAERLEQMGGKVVEFGFEDRGLQTWQA